MTDDIKPDMAKKSEKLEIRLSYEDKQELSAVAETEGRSVSDLVRGLIRRYIKATSARLPQKRSWLKWAAIGLGVWLATVLLLTLAAWAHMSRVNNLQAQIDENSFYLPVLAQDGYTTKMTLPGKDDQIQINLSVTEKDEFTTHLKAEICLKIGDECDLISSPILIFNPDTFASIKIDNVKGHSIFMRLNPPVKSASKDVK